MSNEKEDGDFTLADWKNSEMRMYDRTAEFEQYISPLVDQLTAACEAHGIGMSVCFDVRQNQTGNSHARSHYLPSPEDVSPGLLLHALVKNPDVYGLQKFQAINESAQERISRMLAKATGRTQDGEPVH